MNKKILLTFKILGIVLIIFGITITVIPLFSFDGDTFKLIPALMSGLFLPLVGIVMIVVTTIIGANMSDEDLIDDISEKMKNTISEIEKSTSKSASHKCNYCGSKCKENDVSCPNCGAKLK